MQFGIETSIALAALLGLGLAGASGAAAAQPYPTKPIRLIVPFAPGGGTDITARTIALKLTERWGQQVVVDNRPGANGTIGLDITSQAAPDGYTISMISSSHSVNVSLIKKLPYDLVRDFAPITQATSQPYALVVHPSVPAKSVKEFVAHARANPGKLNYGSSGTGGLSHLSGALFGSLAKIDIVHIPYKGGSPAMQEAGVPGYAVAGWYGVVAPAKVPQPILEKLNREIANILRAPGFSQVRHSAMLAACRTWIADWLPRAKSPADLERQFNVA